MTLQLPIRSRTLFILAIILLVVILFAWTAYRFDQASQLSEQHTYSYSIDLSYTSTIDNVTLILPVPELNSTPILRYIPAGQDSLWCLPGLEYFGRPRERDPDACHQG